MGPLIRQVATEYGGYWSENPDFPSTDWQIEVVQGNTRLGYWEWVIHRLDEQGGQ